MNKKSGRSKDATDMLVRGIKRKTRKHGASEGKIRIVLAGLRGEESICAVSPRGHRRELALRVVQGVSGSRESAAFGRYGSAGDDACDTRPPRGF